MQSFHHSCFSRLSSKCCLRWFSNLPGSCISEISLPAQCPFPGTWAISGGSARSITLLGFLLSHHEARALFGTGSILKQWVTVLQEGTVSDTLGLSLPGHLLLLQAPPERKTSCPSSPSKPKVGKCNSLSTAYGHTYSALTSDSDNFAAEIPCRKENTEYTLSKRLLALAGYSAPGRGGYIQSLKLFQASQSSRQQNTCGCTGTRFFQSLCDSTKWHKSELPVTNCMSPWPFLQSQLSSSGYTGKKAKM